MTRPDDAGIIAGRMTAENSAYPWYVTGLAFECASCGRCCAGPAEGYVWATDEEIAAIADYMGVSEAELRRKYVRKIAERFSLKERKPSKDCVFLQPTGVNGRGCAIYPVRPSQCRTWPFWAQNLTSPDTWARAGMRCRGINRGRVHVRDEIERTRDGSTE